MIFREIFKNACTLDRKAIRFFEIFAAAIAVIDLWEQWHFLRGTLVDPVPLILPLLASALAVALIIVKKSRKWFCFGAVFCHYLSVMLTESQTEGDSWYWLMMIAYLGIPNLDDDSKSINAIHSYWCGALKSTGFFVYIFAGLHKAFNPLWWSGNVLPEVLKDSTLVNAPFGELANWPVVCVLLSLLTLFQRLIAPWGLWSGRPWIRKGSVLILASMHIAYLVMLRIGTFPWVGLLYLSLFWFLPDATSASLPKGDSRVSKRLAIAFVSYTFLYPLFIFIGIETHTRDRFDSLTRVKPPGFLMTWRMYSYFHSETLEPELKVWDFGENRDYFRRRLIFRGKSPVNEEKMRNIDRTR